MAGGLAGAALGRAADPDLAAEIGRLDTLARLLDAHFRVPVLGWRFGIDPILGLIPLAGDAVALGPSLYLIWRAHRLGLGPRVIGRMLLNSGIDFVVGSVPIAGTVFDVAFKANLRNAALLRRELGLRVPPDLRSPL